MANERIVNRENLKAFREKFQEKLENGQIVPSKALQAKDIQAVSTESGATQETPFISQGTGTANGADIVDTGPVGKQLQKQGNTVVVNQRFTKISTTTFNTNSTYGTLSKSGEILTYTVVSGTSVTNAQIYNNAISGLFPVAGHTYFISVYAKCSSGSPIVKLDKINVNHTLTTSWQQIGGIVTLNNISDYLYIIQNTSNSSVGDTIEYKEIQVVDLTQWFNGDIPTSLTADNFSWYHNYGDYIPFNTGTLVDSNGRYLVCGGRNAFDEVLEGNGISGGNNYISSNNFRTKNYIPVIPNKKYSFMYNRTLLGGYMYVYEYDKNKNWIEGPSTSAISSVPYTRTLSPNTRYVRLNFYKGDSSWASNVPTKEQAQIVVSLYYTPQQGGQDYDQYYPYEEPKVYDTGTETLLSTGVKYNASGERIDVHDSKLPDGTITHNVGIETLDSDKAVGSTITISGIKSDTTNVSCKYGNIIEWGTISGTTITLTKALSNGDEIYYEKATPTTEEGTPFSENIEINDYGTMGWYSAYTDYSTNTIVDIPQGCKIFYPAWYVGFIDSLGQREDIQWKAEKIASTDQLVPQKSSSRLQKTLVITGAESEDWSTSGTYASVKRFNLAGTFYRYYDADHPRGIGEATSTGLTIAWIQDSGFANITTLSACFYGGTGASVPQFILLIPNSENVSTVEELRTWLASHNITISYDSSKYILEATLIGDSITYEWVAK